jgi:hypothetical protein
MAGVARGLLNVTKRIVKTIQDADARAEQERYGSWDFDETDVALAFVSAIEEHIAEETNFVQSPDPKSVLPWVLEEFPCDLLFNAEDESHIIQMPFKLTGGMSESPLGPPGEKVIVCHVEMDITTLNHPSRVGIKIGNMNPSDGGGVVRPTPTGGFECSRPLLITSGEYMDRYISTRLWNHSLIQDSNSPEEGVWHRDLRGLLMLIECAHLAKHKIRWTIYRCILDHSGGYYHLPAKISAQLYERCKEKYQPVSLDQDIELTTTDNDLEIEGTLSLLCYHVFDQVPVSKEIAEDDTEITVSVGDV